VRYPGGISLKARKKELFVMRRQKRLDKALLEKAKNIHVMCTEQWLRCLILCARIDDAVREQTEAERKAELLAKRLKKYESWWVGKYCRPVHGGMNWRKVTKITHRRDKVFMVHYADGAFHQIVPRNLSDDYPEKDDLIITKSLDIDVFRDMPPHPDTKKEGP
jgi:hypothetical protein